MTPAAPCAGFVWFRWFRPSRFHRWISGSDAWDTVVNNVYIHEGQRVCLRCGKEER